MASAFQRKKTKRAFSFATVILVIIGVVLLVYWGSSSALDLDNKIAIQGFDPVAFFKDHKAVKGSENFTCTWKGLVWHFKNREYRALFMQTPEDFAPQYGGNCAYSTSLGKEQMGLAKYWHIQNEKLYLNANPISHFLWKRQPNCVEKADQEWLRLTSQPQ